MTKKLLYGGGFLLLFLFLCSLILVYKAPKQKKGISSLGSNKRELTFDLLLKNGYLSVTCAGIRSFFDGIRGSNPKLELKEDGFILTGSSKIGVFRNGKYVFKDFSGSICRKYKIKSKRVSISIKNSKIESIKIKKFVIKGKRILLFSQKEKSINVHDFCLNPTGIFRRLKNQNKHSD
jgi:hypothetical protein